MNKILLREIERADIPTINAWRANREVTDMLGGPFRHVGREIDERWFEQYLAARGSSVRLAICVAQGELVGVVYLLNIDWINRSAEFAIWIGEATAHGKGIGTAATREALRHAFDDLNLERIYLTVRADNAAALKLYRRIRFTEEGTMRRAVYKAGRFHDMKMMALLRADYAGDE